MVAHVAEAPAFSAAAARESLARMHRPRVGSAD